MSEDVALNDARDERPDHDEVIEPVAAGFRSQQPVPQSAAPVEPGSRTWIGAVLLTVLLAVAVGVVFVLPSWVEEQRETAAVAVEPVETQAPVATEPAAPVLSPQELARLREEAEALLAELLSQQAQLEALSAESWGDEQWREYQASARAGDDAYLANAFGEAVPAYTGALEIGRALLQRSADIIASAVQAGATALEAGNASVAEEQFALVLGIEPEHEAASAGLARAQRLPEVLELVEQGLELDREGDLEGAAEAYREALAIDPGWVNARSALRDVERRILDSRFERVMSQGFAALGSEDYDAAIEHFEQALKLEPGSQDAENGRLQAEQGQRLDQIALVEARASAFERRELWERAVEQYETVLAIDQGLVFAQEGLERSRYRADLDTKFSYLLGNPNLLFEDAVLSDADALLGEAEALPDPGPRLSEQTSELSRLVRLASTPIEIELRSDEMTQVTLYRVGPLGAFAQTRLELRPGTYTALGSRDGYRDVRETFTILPGRDVPAVYVACVEPI